MGAFVKSGGALCQCHIWAKQSFFIAEAWTYLTLNFSGICEQIVHLSFEPNFRIINEVMTAQGNCVKNCTKALRFVSNFNNPINVHFLHLQPPLKRCSHFFLWQSFNSLGKCAKLPSQRHSSTFTLLVNGNIMSFSPQLKLASSIAANNYPARQHIAQGARMSPRHNDICLASERHEQPQLTRYKLR